MTWKDKIIEMNISQGGIFKNTEIMETTISRVADAIQNREGRLVINGNVVSLPAPQKSGTETQQRTYAEMKARKIVELNK